MAEFTPYPKTARLFRECVITEKIDGTNAGVHVEHLALDGGGAHVRVAAQSRNRLITPDADNFGFARWVAEHADDLATVLGPGLHFGEWWGSGIQRGYGLPPGEKRFSLFNAARWASVDLSPVVGLGVVPCLYAGVFDTDETRHAVDRLKRQGSAAAPGFMRPEGVVVYHVAARLALKVLIENDAEPKGAAA